MKYTISMAKILLLTHIYPPAVDGGSKVIAKMGEYFQKHGHQTLVLSSNCSSTDDFTKLKPNTITAGTQKNIIRLPVITIFHRPLKLIGRIFPNFITLSKGPIFSFLPFLKSFFQILKYQPDLIITGPLPSTVVSYARFIRFFTKSKMLTNSSFHFTDRDFQTPLLLNSLQKSDYLWTLTSFESEYFKNILKIPSSKIIQLGNGVDSTFIIKQNKINYSRNTRLIYIGSFAAHKGVLTLLEAFRSLPNNYHLTLAGQKTLYFPQIQHYLERLDSQTRKRIKFIFSFSNNQLSSLLDTSTILILPSSQESFGLVLIEAMARGKAVIASDIPSSTELIKHSHSGLLFKLDDSQDLKNKILSLSTDPKLLQKFGENGLSFVKNNFTWDKIGKTLCQKLAI